MKNNKLHLKFNSELDFAVSASLFFRHNKALLTLLVYLPSYQIPYYVPAEILNTCKVNAKEAVKNLKINMGKSFSIDGDINLPHVHWQLMPSASSVEGKYLDNFNSSRLHARLNGAPYKAGNPSNKIFSSFHKHPELQLNDHFGIFLTSLIKIFSKINPLVSDYFVDNPLEHSVSIDSRYNFNFTVYPPLWTYLPFTIKSSSPFLKFLRENLGKSFILSQSSYMIYCLDR